MPRRSSEILTAWRTRKSMIGSERTLSGSSPIGIVDFQRLNSPAMRGFIVQRPATERSEVERQVMRCLYITDMTEIFTCKDQKY